MRTENIFDQKKHLEASIISPPKQKIIPQIRALRIPAINEKLLQNGNSFQNHNQTVCDSNIRTSLIQNSTAIQHNNKIKNENPNEAIVSNINVESYYRSANFYPENAQISTSIMNSSLAGYQNSKTVNYNYVTSIHPDILAEQQNTRHNGSILKNVYEYNLVSPIHKPHIGPEVKDLTISSSHVTKNILLNKKTEEKQHYYRAKFPLPEIGVPDENISPSDSKTSETLICSVCLSLVYDPIKCANCDQVFCRSCLEKVLKKTGLCPMRCKFVPKEIDRIVRNILDSIEVKCINKECKCKVKYGQLEEHYNQCKFTDYFCANKGCTFKGKLDEVEAHIKDCQFRDINCKFCEQIIKYNEIKQHVRETCPNVSVLCKLCGQRFLRKFYLTQHFSANNDNINCLQKQIENLKAENAALVKENKELKGEPEKKYSSKTTKEKENINLNTRVEKKANSSKKESKYSIIKTRSDFNKAPLEFELRKEDHLKN